jgi:hypothetical protein
MQKHSDHANRPTLPIVCGYDGYALDLPLVGSYESDLGRESRDILPAAKSGSIDEQPDLAMLIDERVNLGPKLAKVCGR